MIRKTLLVAGMFGVVLPLAAQTPPPPPSYWCVYTCADGTKGKTGPVSGGAACNSASASACSSHGGVVILGLEPYAPPPPPPPYWCSVWCQDGTEGGGPVSSGAECDALGNRICEGHGGTRALGLEDNETSTDAESDF